MDNNVYKNDKQQKDVVINELRNDWIEHCVPLEPVNIIKDGIRFDFNYGARVFIPETSQYTYRIQFFDGISGNMVYNDIHSAGDGAIAGNKYYIPYAIKIFRVETNELIFQHVLNLKNRNVVIYIPSPCIGDTIAWFAPIEDFRKKHDCNVFVYFQNQSMIELFRDEYQNIRFVSKDDLNQIMPYATYRIGVQLDGGTVFSPIDYRQVNLIQVASNALGMDSNIEYKPIISYDRTKERIIKEPYVCIATHGSGMCKEWLNPFGWEEVIDFLKNNGYRVLCIDRDKFNGQGMLYSKMPYNADDFTGNKPLKERSELISNCDFFIGIGSGLSWLAWALNKPVVLISGFSMPFAEFYTPYRIINYQVCHGCYNDVRHKFKINEYLWCPRHFGKPQQYECSRGISSKMVIDKIKTIPEFIQHYNNNNINKEV